MPRLRPGALQLQNSNHTPQNYLKLVHLVTDHQEAITQLTFTTSRITSPDTARPPSILPKQEVKVAEHCQFHTHLDQSSYFLGGVQCGKDGSPTSGGGGFRAECGLGVS